MTYRDTLTNLADRAEQQVLAVYALFRQGVLSRTETVARIAVLVAAGNGRAASLADLALAAELMVALRAPVPIGGTHSRVPLAGTTLAHYVDVDRLTKAAATVLDVADTSDVPEKIVARLARSEPLETAANTYSEAMNRSPLVKGWVRSLSPSACQLCRWWWREGRVWPSEHPMPTHKGCTCTPKPVLREHIASTGYTRRLNNAR